MGRALGGIGRAVDMGATNQNVARVGLGAPMAGFRPGARGIGTFDVGGFEAATLDAVELHARRVTLRPLAAGDADAYRSLIRANGERLSATGTGPDAGASSVEGGLFDELLEQLDLLRVLDQSYVYAVVEGDELVGEVALECIVRGHVQSAFVAAWIDETRAGEQLAEEAYLALVRHAFEDLGLHRVEAAVLTDNDAVKAALATLAVRSEGVAPRYLEVNGEWRDHERFVITAEEWTERRDELSAAWLA